MKNLPEGGVKEASWGFLYPLGGFCIWGGDAMSTEGFKRKHIVILSANSKGKEVQDATGICNVR